MPESRFAAIIIEQWAEKKEQVFEADIGGVPEVKQLVRSDIRLEKL